MTSDVMTEQVTHSNEADIRIFTLGSRMEELFNQQYDRIGFHNDEEDNAYRKEEHRLSSLMLDNTLTNAEHLEYAKAILTLAETYTNGFMRSLHSLNADIDRHLIAAKQELDGINAAFSDPTQEVGAVLANLRRWLELSEELQKARLIATQSILMRVDCDKFLPNRIIGNRGRIDVPVPPEDFARFQQVLTDFSTMLKQSFQDNERIQNEKLPLVKALFNDDSHPKLPQAPSEPIPQHKVVPLRIHPLHNKAWFRLAKLAYICLWILAAGSCLVLVSVGDSGSLALTAGVISILLLIGIRKGFYYITLGRTTVFEKARSGFADWDQLSRDFEPLKATNPDLYASVVSPFLHAWKEEYGRRVPREALDLLRRRTDTELEELRTKKQKVITEAMEKRSCIEISSLRQNLEKSKAGYRRTDRAAYTRAIDTWMMKLEAKYGTSIPLDEAVRIADELDTVLR